MSIIRNISGPRTLICPCVGAVHPAGAETPVPVYVPTIPMGELVVPLRHLLLSLMEVSTGDELEARERVAKGLTPPIKRAFFDACVNDGVPLTMLQTIITDAGSMETVSASVAYSITQQQISEGAAKVLEAEMDALARAFLGDDGQGGESASFESLGALYNAAGKPRNKSPKHWMQRHRRRIAYFTSRGGKGVWQVESGDWFAQHELALDYAQFLFVDFHVYTISLLHDHPSVRAKLDQLFAGPASGGEGGGA
ncbi:hypothetical protein ACW7BJ_33250 [Azospirillum argentinense]